MMIARRHPNWWLEIFNLRDAGLSWWQVLASLQDRHKQAA
jgi:hypothetical protein